MPVGNGRQRKHLTLSASAQVNKVVTTVQIRKQGIVQLPNFLEELRKTSRAERHDVPAAAEGNEMLVRKR